MFENPRTGRQAINFTTNVPKILDLKSSSEQIFSENWRWVPLSFVPFSYKLGLVRTLVDRVFKINNTWTGFHLDISNLTKTLRKNLFPSSVIENVVRKFVNNYFTSDSPQSVARKDNCLYFKLPYIGPFSIITQRRIKKLVNTFCSDLEIKLVFTPFKISSWFGAKDPYPCGFTIASHLQVFMCRL